MRERERKGNKQQNKLERRAKSPSFVRWHVGALLLAIFDIVAVNGAYFVALWLRYDCHYTKIPPMYMAAWMKFAPIYAVLCVLVYWCFHLYQSLWKYASFSELKRTLLATILLAVLHGVGISLLFQVMPTSYYLVGMFIQFWLVLGIRFAQRFVSMERRVLTLSKQQKAMQSRVMLIGAGSAGQLILRDLRNTNMVQDQVCCIIDDDPNKQGCFIEGVPIVGDRNDILYNVEKYKIQKIYLAIPSATAEQRRDILNICKETSCELKNLPGMYQFVNGNLAINAMKDVAVEDLLGREPACVDMKEIYHFLADKVILVTGGGGSIGSELCRQIAEHKPKQLVILDVYENNAHAIQLELQDKYPDLNLAVCIGSVRDSRRLDAVFTKYKPDVVYHAAAHKHVPLMEVSPCESIKNNAVGTYKTAYAAMVHGCKRFVLISTDKAVNPTNVMGASKRLCEMIIQSFDRKIRDGKATDILPLSAHDGKTKGRGRYALKGKSAPKTEFVAVRFGNVLGSNGSVIPRFKEQIAKGGPVTVTHPDIIRYFMLIPEAASLVLQAGTYARGGEIFVLDMGSPVKIDTLARNLIRLSGLKPDVDIKITYTGLRAGEKLYEEKLMSEEGLRRTPNKMIHIGSPIPFDVDLFLKQIRELMKAAYEERDEDIRSLVAEIVTTYHPAGEHGSENKGEAFEKQMSMIAEKGGQTT